jgi:hypothetical protein
MARVFIGVDPHKLSATIEVVDEAETILATGQFGTDKAGYAAMRRHVAAYPDRVWAVEGSNGAGRPLAQRLPADGETVVDVPAKLSARARMFDTGHNRKTDPHDAHAVAVVAVRTTGLRVPAYDAQLEALRLLVDRRAELSRARIHCTDRNRYASWTGTAPIEASSARDRAPPTLPRREPADEPHDPHHRDHPTTPRHRRPGPIPAQARRRQDQGRSHALPQAPHLRRPLPPARHRRQDRCDRRHERGPGRAQRGGTSIQRGRLTPAHRHFGPATTRTRETDATPARDDAEDHQVKNAPTRLLTTEGCRKDVVPRWLLPDGRRAVGREFGVVIVPVFRSATP